jgi:iron complex outermembrane receptor protein
MFRRTKLCSSLIVAFGGTVLAGAALAQQSQRIEITGSAIKRVNAETAAPVTVINREQITRTGATSVNELLKSISVVDINDQGELASNSPGGSGTARVRLRGLGESQTLVLINGRRVPKNPLADASGAGSAFNLNTIPVSAIERIEILKDGGSAIYGADAVAGVFNVILRKDFTGATVRGTFGESSRGDGAEQAVSAVAGFGDPAKDRFNVMGALDVFKRDPILRADRGLTRSVDFRSRGPVTGYNLDGRSSFAPEGNYVTGAGFFAGQTVRPCPPENQSGVFCVYDFNRTLLTSYNGADRVSGLLNGQFQITPDHMVYARWIGSESKDFFEAHPVPAVFPSAPGSPFPQYAGRFMQGGPRITDRKSTLNHFDVGAEGVFMNLDYKVGLTNGTAKTTNSDKNYYNRNLWNPALSAGLIDATSNNNDPAFVESLKVSPVRTGEETIKSIDLLVSGDAFKLPAGTVRFAVGASKVKETIEDNPDPLQVAGLVIGSIQQSAVAADQTNDSLFLELQVPVTKTIEAQLAVRSDDYGREKSTSPKVAVKWQALPALALRASYSESFKMPTLKQQFATAGQGAITLTPGQCQQVTGGSAAACTNGSPAQRRTGSNPDLGPESAKTYNIGIIGEAGPVSVSMDFFRIAKEDNISTLTLQSAINGGFFFFDTANSNWVILQNLQNFAQSLNSGVDIDARLRLPGTAIGNVTMGVNATYYTDQKTRTTAADPWAEFGNTYSTPLWRANFTVSAEKGPWLVTGVLRGVGGFWDTDISRNNITATTPGGNRKVSAYDEVDLTVRWSGIKNLRLTGSVKNVFDRMPPFSARNASSNNYTQMGFAELYTVRGRYFQVSAEYDFR